MRQIVSSETLCDHRLPPGQRLIDHWPVLHHSSVPDIEPSRWRLRICGLVEEERELSIEDFQALPRIEVVSDIHCVTGWTRLGNTWEGVSASTIQGLVSIKPEANFVMVHGADGFRANLSLQDFMEEGVVFALKHDGQALAPEHGAPVRLVVPKLYFWKSVKWVTGIEFMAEDKPGFWEGKGYHMHGDPWREERHAKLSESSRFLKENL